MDREHTTSYAVITNKSITKQAVCVHATLIIQHGLLLTCCSLYNAIAKYGLWNVHCEIAHRWLDGARVRLVVQPHRCSSNALAFQFTSDNCKVIIVVRMICKCIWIRILRGIVAECRYRRCSMCAWQQRCRQQTWRMAINWRCAKWNRFIFWFGHDCWLFWLFNVCESNRVSNGRDLLYGVVYSSKWHKRTFVEYSNLRNYCSWTLHRKISIEHCVSEHRLSGCINTMWKLFEHCVKISNKWMDITWILSNWEQTLLFCSIGDVQQIYMIYVASMICQWCSS